MKLFLFLAVSIFAGNSVFGAEELFYIGALTDQSPRQGIYLGKLDADTGKLGALTPADNIKNPGFLVLSPDQKFLYAAITPGEKESAVAAFSRKPDGTLTLLNEQPSGGEGACHVGVDVTGRNVFVANYLGGNIACFRTNPDGSLGERSAFVTFTGSGPDPVRQKKPYAHSIYTDAGNKFVYACDLGSDNVWNFKFNVDHGTLVANDPPAAKVPPGSGPRHLAFHPNGKFVYVANEMGCSVTVFSRDANSGRLTPQETVSTLPPGTSPKGVTVAEIFCHSSGKWLYVSNRGFDTMTVYAIASDGKLTFIQNTSSIVKFPRSFAIDPTGRWLITAGQKDNRIALLKIDQATGRLTATDQSAEVGVPFCVLFVPRRQSP